MEKKIFFSITALMVCAVIAAVSLHAQTQPIGAPEKSVSAVDVYAHLERLGSKIESLSLDMHTSHKELKAQLQEIMNTQQLILKELAIIKVRSTR
jgi:hypothetical protein